MRHRIVKQTGILLTGLACAGVVACNENGSTHNAGPAEVATDKVILEGTLGPDPVRPALGRHLVTGSSAPKGSTGFVREETQILQGSETENDGAVRTSPQNTDSNPR